MQKLIVGNWKMNGTAGQAATLGQAISKEAARFDKCQLVICPPFVHLGAVSGLKNIKIGAQDCSPFPSGAYTGDVSASMLVEGGCSYVILGHSERRQHYHETNEFIAGKAVQAHKSGLITIICVGETENEREAGRETEVVARQLERSIPTSASQHNLVIAYEPVWAIGTGKTATPEDVKIMHEFIRRKLLERLAGAENMQILYGGSMKPQNAQDLLAVPHVHGGLVGGASLDPAQFLAIAQAL
ncbi:MAG: triose-phosphate isomerase [Alphaproteobacteria bacterium]